MNSKKKIDCFQRNCDLRNLEVVFFGGNFFYRLINSSPAFSFSSSLYASVTIRKCVELAFMRLLLFLFKYLNAFSVDSFCMTLMPMVLATETFKV